MQAAEVRLSLRVEFDVGLQVIKIKALEDDVAPQTQSERIRNLYGNFSRVERGDQLLGLLVVQLDVMSLGRAHAPGDIKPANLCAHAVVSKRHLHLEEDK